MKILSSAQEKGTYYTNVLSRFARNQKQNVEINPEMDVATVSDIISDRLIEIVKKDLDRQKK